MSELDKRINASCAADAIIKKLKEKKKVKQPQLRVSALDKLITEIAAEKMATKQPQSRVPITTPHISVPRVHTNVHAEPSVPPPIATRTQAARASAKIKAAAQEVTKQGPAGNTRSSKSTNTLQRAMYAACFIDNKNGDAQRLASRKYPVAMFAAALAVMDMESGDMIKYRQHTNHLNPAIHRTWNASTANEIE